LATEGDVIIVSQARSERRTEKVERVLEQCAVRARCPSSRWAAEGCAAARRDA
jgi:hypothetical protein